MIKIILGSGILIYFLIRIFLGFRNRSLIQWKVKNPKMLTFIAVDLFIASIVIFQLTFPQQGKVELFQFSEMIEFLGLSFFVAGTIFASLGRIVLGRNWRPAMASSKIDGEQRLVVGAPFSMVRHPIYGGMILMGLGFELALTSWFLLFIIPLVFLVYRQAKSEEKLLEKKFPREYKKYKKNVRKMFFPIIF